MKPSTDKDYTTPFNSLCQCWPLSSDSPLRLNLNSCHHVLSAHFLLSFSWERQSCLDNISYILTSTNFKAEVLHDFHLFLKIIIIFFFNNLTSSFELDHIPRKEARVEMENTLTVLLLGDIELVTDHAECLESNNFDKGGCEHSARWSTVNALSVSFLPCHVKVRANYLYWYFIFSVFLLFVIETSANARIFMSKQD